MYISVVIISSFANIGKSTEKVKTDEQNISMQARAQTCTQTA